jgi:hypothetical protein
MSDTGNHGSASNPSQAKARLVVVRDSERDLQRRDVQVFLDGDYIGSIGYLGRLEHEMEPGRHSVRVYNTLLSKTLGFEIDAGATAAVRTGNVPVGCLLGWVTLVGAGPVGVLLEPVEDLSQSDASAPGATD